MTTQDYDQAHKAQDQDFGDGLVTDELDHAELHYIAVILLFFLATLTAVLYECVPPPWQWFWTGAGLLAMATVTYAAHYFAVRADEEHQW